MINNVRSTQILAFDFKNQEHSFYRLRREGRKMMMRRRRKRRRRINGGQRRSRTSLEGLGEGISRVIEDLMGRDILNLFQSLRFPAISGFPHFPAVWLSGLPVIRLSAGRFPGAPWVWRGAERPPGLRPRRSKNLTCMSL